jgi:hypothetical protein
LFSRKFTTSTSRMLRPFWLIRHGTASTFLHRKVWRKVRTVRARIVFQSTISAIISNYPPT